MKTVIIASTNPVKIEAVRAGFTALWPDRSFDFRGAATDSGISAQPMTIAETLQGARNRAANARLIHPQAAYTVGVEGGIEITNEGMEVFAWIVVQNGTQEGISRTATFYLPRRVTKLVQAGHELGDADDIVFGRENSKQNTGSVGILTGDVITRTTYYQQAVTLALIPFANPALDFSSE